MRRVRVVGAVAAVALILTAWAGAQAQTAGQAQGALATPEQYLGFKVGTDKKLATWPQVVEYMKRAGAASDRIRYTELKPSTMGNPFPLLLISSPKNLARLAEIQANQRKLAYPYELAEGEAEKIIATNPAVLLITLTIHSTEIGSTQMSLELVHRLATEKSAYIEGLLDKVVFLLCPSVNPDGQVMVVDWYNKNVGTEYEFAPMPWLYHKYTGHDNNRDAYMLTQVETQNVTKILYKDWFPLVFLDEHQMGSGGPRIFVAPFDDPVNPNIDPGAMAGSNLMGMYMFSALNVAGHEGVVYGERFTWWWQGSAKNGAWYHNMVGLLTEVASARIATPVEQQRAPLGLVARREGGEGGGGEGGGADPRRPIAAPTDTWVRTNYPKPWLGGTWRLRDIVDYELVITYALLDGVASNREMLQRNFYKMNRKAIAAGKKGEPFAYVVPAQQHDPGAAARMLRVLDEAGVQVYRATAAFEAEGKKWNAGTYIVPMGQPFRNYAKDLLEAQKYPMRPVGQGESPERPYDVTGWTLPLQMGVNGEWIEKPFEARMEQVSPVPAPKGELVATLIAPHERRPGKTMTQAFLLPHEWNASAKAVNRLLQGKTPGFEVWWAAKEFQAGARTYPAGSIFAQATKAGNASEAMEKLAQETNLRIVLSEIPNDVEKWKLKAPRIGVYQPWTASMDEGWTRWLLEQYEFAYTTVHNEDLRAGNLESKFDVILFASQAKNSILNGSRGAWVRPEHRGGLGEEGSRAIREFVQAGGMLVTLGSAADFAIDELGLPVQNALRGVPSAKFYCPGAVLEVWVDNQHPVAYGMPARTSAYFLSNPAFELTAPFTASAGRAVVKYPGTNPLQSGWIGGPEYLYEKVGVADVSYGKGRVVLLGFAAQFRGQPEATFKLLFNALHWAGAGK